MIYDIELNRKLKKKKKILSHRPHVERDLSHSRSPRGWSHNWE